MIIEADVYFEHFGVKGQRWGVRKEQSQSTTSSKNHRNRNIALAAGVVAVGATFTAVLLKSKGNTRVHDYGYSFPTIDIGPMGLSGKRFFEHHGIKGQRWGVVNKDKSGGDNSSIRSRLSDRNLKINTDRQNMLKARAAKGNVRISEINNEIKALPPGIKSVYKRRDLNVQKNATVKQRDSDLKKATKPPTSGLTSTQKKVLIGAGVAAVVVGYSLASKYTDAEGIAASVRRGQNQLKYGDVFKRNPDFAGEMSSQEVLKNVVKGINPGYGSTGGHMNCRRATFAYELRRRGYDVVATTSPTGYGQNESGLVNALIKGDRNLISRQSMSNYAHFHDVVGGAGVRTRAVARDTRTHSAFTESVHELSKLREVLAKQPHGARGEAVFDMGGFAHSMQWENFNGVPHIFDAQKGSHFPVTAKGLRDLTNKWGQPSVTHITRLDNVDLDLGFLSRWATNSKDVAPAVTRIPSMLDPGLARNLLESGSVLAN